MTEPDLDRTAAGAAEKTTIARDLARALFGTAAFGAAAATGHGIAAALHGAWAAPALFAGGAILATPPLYLAAALGGGRLSATELAGCATRSLASTATVLLGLAVPAAFFSATLRSPSAAPLAIVVAAIVGGAGVLALAHQTTTRAETAPKTIATLAWAGFALLLGVRLIGVLGRASGLFGGAS